MKKSELREIVKNTILENRPQTEPSRQAPDREVIEKPDTAPEKPTRRRTLTPPEHAPSTAPKAEGMEKNVANKIASRFQKLGGSLNENNTSRDKAMILILGKTNDYSREDLDQKTDQELAKILFGLIGK